MGQRLVKAAVGQEMAQLGIEFAPVGGGPGGDFLRCVFQRLKMACGIPIPPCVVRDDGDALAEEIDEFRVHGGKMGYRGARVESKYRDFEPTANERGWERDSIW